MGPGIVHESLLPYRSSIEISNQTTCFWTHIAVLACVTLGLRPRLTSLTCHMESHLDLHAGQGCVCVCPFVFECCWAPFVIAKGDHCLTQDNQDNWNFWLYRFCLPLVLPCPQSAHFLTDPAYINSGQLTSASDVFALGMLSTQFPFVISCSNNELTDAGIMMGELLTGIMSDDGVDMQEVSIRHLDDCPVIL